MILNITPTRVLVVAALAVLTGCGKPPQPMGQMPPAAVTVVTLKTSKVTLTRELPGRVSARLVAEVRPQIGGIIKRVAFTEGSQVQAGQVLYELDDAPYRAALASAEAARLKAQAAMENAQRAANRGDQLVKDKLISTQDHDNLVVALHQAQADLAAADANVQNSRINLGYARITAPISGRIGKSSLTQGALVVTNQSTALATIQQLNEVYVDVTQSSSEWLQLRNELGIKDSARGNRNVQLVLEDGTQYKHLGKLQFSDVTVDQSTGSFLLRVLAPNPEGLLLPGMYVRAVVGEGQLADAILAPQQGITRDARGNALAMVVGADNKVEARQVTALRTVGDQWLISDGLKAGDRLIVEGLQRAMPGMPVQPSEAGNSAASASSASNG